MNIGNSAALAVLASTLSAVAFSDGASEPGAAPGGKTWRPSERWIGVNLPYCLYHREVRKDARYREEDFRLVAKLGFNFIRLPLDYRCWIKDGDWHQIDERALDPLDEAIEWAKKYNLHVQFCFHRIPGYSVNRWPAEKTDILKNPDALVAAKRHWAYFAKRWRDVPNETLSFNLFNEPGDHAFSAEKLVEIEFALADAIHAEDPKRFIVCDGLNARPVKALESRSGLVGQAARGYSPSSLSNYGNAWMGEYAMRMKPRWPMYGFTSPLHAKGKAWYRPLVVSSAPAGEWTVRFGRMSAKTKFVVRSDGKEVASVSYVPKMNDPKWENAESNKVWHFVAARPVDPWKFTLEKSADLSFSVDSGDWAEVELISVEGADGRRADFHGDFNWVANPNSSPYRFRGFDQEIPFLKEGDPLTGEDWMEREFRGWVDCAERGNFVMIGECGASAVGYPIYIRWMEDQLKVWHRHGFGFAFWTLYGNYGILDTRRKGAIECDFEGHRLDKGVYDLILKYSDIGKRL